MKYLVVCQDESAFFTNRFNAVNFNEFLICVIDMEKDKITFDGCVWSNIVIDHQ